MPSFKRSCFKKNSNFFEFEERAFKTRVGNANLADLLQKELNLCLPKEISTTNVMTSINHSLPLKEAILNELQSIYHC